MTKVTAKLNYILNPDSFLILLLNLGFVYFLFICLFKKL